MPQAFLILFVYIIGPVAILVWAFQRYKHGVKPKVQEWIVVGIALILMVLFAFSSTWTTTERDQAEVNLIVDELVERYDFPVFAKFQDKPAVEGIARDTRLEIHIYGVVDSAEQDKVVFIAQKLREQYASKPLVLHFIREEIWEEDADGSRRPRRDREELMRKQRID